MQLLKEADEVKIEKAAPKDLDFVQRHENSRAKKSYDESDEQSVEKPRGRKDLGSSDD